jgi:hypothetical protein
LPSRSYRRADGAEPTSFGNLGLAYLVLLDPIDKPPVDSAFARRLPVDLAKRDVVAPFRGIEKLPCFSGNLGRELFV